MSLTFKIQEASQSNQRLHPHEQQAMVHHCTLFVTSGPMGGFQTEIPQIKGCSASKEIFDNRHYQMVRCIYLFTM
jgi:hypothetical protein